MTEFSRIKSDDKQKSTKYYLSCIRTNTNIKHLYINKYI